MQELGRKYPKAGYGGMFYDWLHSDDPKPYNSYGNGGAMRTSPVAFVSSSLDEALMLAEAQSSVTHNHEEGIKGAKAITAAMYLALNGSSKEEIREHIENNYYKLDFTISSIYRKYRFDVSSQGSVPQAIEAFLEGEDFEDSIRNAICLGGDADTLACMTGAISECFYGFPEDLVIDTYLPPDLKEIRHNFNSKVIEFKEQKKR
jgi:type I restriction enzyme M protein